MCFFGSLKDTCSPSICLGEGDDDDDVNVEEMEPGTGVARSTELAAAIRDKVVVVDEEEEEEEEDDDDDDDEVTMWLPRTSPNGSLERFDVATLLLIPS